MKRTPALLGSVALFTWLALLALTVTGVLRGWHWVVRCLLHAAWLAGLIVWLYFDLARYQLGG